MKRQLTRSLLFYDIIAFIFIFISIFVIFESVIKKIFVNYGTDRFKNEFSMLQFELSTGISALDEKKMLDYGQFANECFKYLKLSYLSKSKYDDNVFILVLPSGSVIAGKKSEIEYPIEKSNIYQYFNDLASVKQDSLKEFRIGGEIYLGLIETSETGIRKEYLRDNEELEYPIMVIGSKKSDFFYLIDITRIFFIAWLFAILGAIAFFKIRLTARASSQIKKVSSMLKEESINIRAKGIIGESLKHLNSDFDEVTVLNNSSIELNNALIELKNIVKGVTTEEFFIGTMTKDSSITEQHEIDCSVMFLDIQGFTTISEKHKAHSMKIGIVIFTEVGKVLKKYNGQIRKLLGDAALITFKNMPDTNDAAVRAVCAALESLELVKSIEISLNKEFNPLQNRNLEIEFNFRIGVDSGIVNEGLYGTPDNFEYGIIGDPVNTASRYEGLNKQYFTNILISENTYQAIQKQTNCIDGQPVSQLHNYRFLILDEARTKGKKESGRILTLYSGSSAGYILAGGNILLQTLSLNTFNKLVEEFKLSIAIWKDYLIIGILESKEKAYSNWFQLVKLFAELDIKYNFMPARQYLRLMLSHDEYILFENDSAAFSSKDKFELTIPSDDWLRNPSLSRELDK